MEFCSAIIVAAGLGRRMNMDISKQYIHVAGKPVLAWTLEKFQDSRLINEIIVVVHRDDLVFCMDDIVKANNYDKVTDIVAGGETRQQSVYNGLMSVSGNSGIICVHDGARPLVSGECILSSIESACKWGAACAGVPVKDTIKQVDQNGIVKGTPDRNTLWAVQTPQAFKKSILDEAHKLAVRQGFLGTDDSTLVERLNIPVKMFFGGYDNIKITTREDLYIAQELLNRNENYIK